MDKFGQRFYDPANLRWSQPEPIDQFGIRQGTGTFTWVTTLVKSSPAECVS
jgi:hypothetical protein